MPKLAKKLSKVQSALTENKPNHRCRPVHPVWTGPCGEGKNGGITFSTLSRYLCCTERFRIHMVEGLRARDEFRAPIEYGNMWHTCEEALASEEAHFGEVVGTTLWQDNLQKYCKSLCQKYPLSQDQINHWYQMATVQFPLYAKHWAEHPDVKNRTPVLQENKFDVWYALPSGRNVRLRGKIDAVDLIEDSTADTGLFIQEDKTKSQIDKVKIMRQLKFDLQTMMYREMVVCAQRDLTKPFPKAFYDKPIMGVRYNVVRRSAHKSTDSMLKKLEEDRADGRIGEWFARWRVTISNDDGQRFKNRCLIPLLENLCDDYEWWSDCFSRHGDVFNFKARHKEFPDHQSRLFITPFGVYDPIKEGGASDLDEYIETGSEVGLRRVDTLFEELE